MMPVTLNDPCETTSRGTGQNVVSVQFGPPTTHMKHASWKVWTL